MRGNTSEDGAMGGGEHVGPAMRCACHTSRSIFSATSARPPLARPGQGLAPARWAVDARATRNLRQPRALRATALHALGSEARRGGEKNIVCFFGSMARALESFSI